MHGGATQGPGGRILLVEDDPVALHLLAEVMRREGHRVTTARDAQTALELAEAHRPDVVISDIRLGGMDGLELLNHLRERLPRVEVVVVTAFGTLDTAVEAVKAGAFDYLSKPFGMDEIVRITRRALEASAAPGDDDTEERSPSQALVGRSSTMTNVFKAIGRVGPLDTSVLILGETGTGKELVARAIHDASARASGPYVAVNCPSLPEGLLESELFGHRRGAFTGASAEHAGLFRAAHGGTILLDEIGDMPMPVQAKLLRVLESRDVRPVGATESVAVDVRVLAATHQDLQEGVEARRFRQDLLYRLNTVTIQIPPLRERPDDLPHLVEALLARLGRGRGRAVAGVTDEVMQAFRTYPWPGNVRELLHVLERAAALGRGRRIELDDLPEGFRSHVGVSPSGGSDLSLRGIEREHIRTVLQSVQGHRARAAAILGIDRKTLYRKLREYELADDEQE